MYFVPMMCTSVRPCGGSSAAGADAAGVLVAAVVVAVVVLAESTVVGVVVATATVDVDAIVDIVEVATSGDDVAAACAAAKGTLRIPTRPRTIAMTMLIPATAMLFVFINTGWLIKLIQLSPLPC